MKGERYGDSAGEGGRIQAVQSVRVERGVWHPEDGVAVRDHEG